MIVRTLPCIMCGEVTQLDLDDNKILRYQAGENVQAVWPEMPPGERELLITGTHPACWDEMFGGSDV